MYLDLPDAPDIRQAELFGIDEGQDVYCPICGEENPEWFYEADGEIIGCSECVHAVDPFDWMERYQN